ncbi:MAG: hypothetical protein ACRDRI_02560 [Pseudonocardiaceae bacterium]
MLVNARHVKNLPAPTISRGAWERKWRAIACYPTQIRMRWPADTGWAVELRTARPGPEATDILRS